MTTFSFVSDGTIDIRERKKTKEEEKEDDEEMELPK